MADNEHRQYGIYLYEQGYYLDAVAQLKTALLPCESSDGWSDLGMAHMAVQQDADAEGAFRRALALEPEHRDAATNLGALLLKLERWPAALAALEAVAPRWEARERDEVQSMIDLCRRKTV